MKKGDLVFFYHSVSGKSVVGVAKVAREHYPDPTAGEGDWSCVDLKPVKPLKTPLSLQQIKDDKGLADLPLVRHSRLSVMPVSTPDAGRLLDLGGTKV